MESFKDFFNNNSSKSMMRYISFVLIWASILMILGGIGLAFTDKLTTTYVGFTIAVISAAIGGKNWAKSIETKEKKDEV